MTKRDECIDEALELIWAAKEDGIVVKNDILKMETHVRITPDIIDKMFAGGFCIEEDGEIHFTERGAEIAGQLIRAHRLTERLFVDILEIEEGSDLIESNACGFEHILSREVRDAICTLLGHPGECPHGRPIPPGECCKRAEKRIEPVVLSLDKLKSGQEGKIVYITTKHHERLDRLTGLGITPGEEVKVHQTFPAFVIKVRETDIAMDTDVLKDIYVRR